MATTLNGRVIRGHERGERLTITSNHHVRTLVSYHDLPAEAREEFDYIADAYAEGYDAINELRFVMFRGSWYDVNESETASDRFKALGWNGWQTQSYFDAVLFRWFDVDGYAFEDGVIVGYAHW